MAGLVKRDGRFLYSHIQAVTEDREKIEEQIAAKINGLLCPILQIRLDGLSKKQMIVIRRPQKAPYLNGLLYLIAIPAAG